MSTLGEIEKGGMAKQNTKDYVLLLLFAASGFLSGCALGSKADEDKYFKQWHEFTLQQGTGSVEMEDLFPDCPTIQQSQRNRHGSQSSRKRK